MEDKNKFYYHLYTVIILLSMYLLVQFFRGGESIVAIHDNLDSTVAYLRFLAASDLLFSTGSFDKELFNIDRNILASEFSVVTLLFYLFPTIVAYGSIVSLKVVISLYAMYQLLRLPTFNVPSKIAIWLAAIYAVMPGFPITYLSQAVLPLMFVFIYNGVMSDSLRGRFFFGIMLVGTAFFSSLIMHGVFFLIYSSCFVIYLFLKGELKKSSIAFLYCLVLSVSFISVEYRIFYIQLFSGYESIRTDSVPPNISFLHSLKDIILNGHYHFESNSLPMILISLLLFLLVVMKREGKVFNLRFNLLICAIVINYVLYAIYFTETFSYYMSHLATYISGFDWSRVVFLNSVFLFVLLGILCKGLRFNFVFIILFGLFINTSIMKTEYNDFRSNLFYGGNDSALVSYNDFYNPELFERIKSDINYRGERSIAVGMHPSILTYNGISTLDSYFSYGSKHNKDLFRTLISPQLSSNKEHKHYFDDWGGRLYIFEDQNNYKNMSVKHVCTGTDLNIDVQVFREFDGRFIFSLCPLDNSSELGLVNSHVYNWPAYGNIFVYQVELDLYEEK